MWCQVWLAAAADDKQDARFTWHRHQVKLMEQGALRNICGPTAATITALVDIGWKPVRPDCWAADDNTSVKIDGAPFTKLQIIARASKDAQTKNWIRASSHCHGSGLERGTPSFKAARRAMSYFRKHGLYSQALALEYCVVGFFREFDDEDFSRAAWCHRCGKGKRNTRYHQIYGRARLTAGFMTEVLRGPKGCETLYA